jgi:hypothetical protein
MKKLLLVFSFIVFLVGFFSIVYGVPLWYCDEPWTGYSCYIEFLEQCSNPDGECFTNGPVTIGLCYIRYTSYVYTGTGDCVIASGFLSCGRSKKI